MNVRSDPAFAEKSARPFRIYVQSLLRSFTLAVIVATVASMFGATNWIADLFAQFKFQWMCGFGILAILWLMARRWMWVVICLIGFGVNAYAVLAHVIEPIQNSSRPVQSVDPSEPSLCLMSLNVLTGNQRWDEVIELIEAHSPDYLVLMEVDSTWERVLNNSLGEFYPHVKFESRPDNFGIAFLSKRPWRRLEVIHSATLQLPSIDVTFGQNEPETDSKPLRIIATHPIPPMSKRNWNARNTQLKQVAKRLDSSTRNVMVGDFNLTPWSPHFQLVLDAGNLSDPSQAFGPAPTWYVFPTWLGGLKIDHSLISSDVVVTGLRVGPDVGSDHRAVILEFK